MCGTERGERKEEQGEKELKRKRERDSIKKER